ncbi:VOC family protein [bacterium]|nr:VOC family protein [bacterium]
MQVSRGELNVYATNVPHSVAFYSQVFGFEPFSDNYMGAGDGEKWQRLRSGDIVLNVFQAETDDQAPPPGFAPSLSADLLIDDLDELVRRLEEFGTRMSEPAEFPGGRYIHFMDPDGIAWEAIEMGTEAVPPPPPEES